VLTFAVILVIFVAALLQGVVGFGFALVAVPILAMMLDAQSAAALSALSAGTVSGMMLIQNRRHVHFGEASGLILSAAAGVPVGVFALAHAPHDILIVTLGVLITGFSLYSLAQATPIELKDRRWRFLAGFLGGILGGAYNTSGPPIVLYGAMRRWSRDRFIGVTQAFFFPVAVMIASGHFVAGFWTRDILNYYALGLPGIVIAILLGKRLARGITSDTLSKAVYGLCVVLGLVIIVTNVL